MLKSISYVVKENITNMYRIFCIAKYELLADMRDSKFGLFWNFASPAIQVFTYWLVFGIGLQRKGYDGIPNLFCGMVVYLPLHHPRLQCCFLKEKRYHEDEVSDQRTACHSMCQRIFQPSVHAGHHSIHGYSFRLLSFHSLAWSDLFCLLRFYVR